MPSEPTARPAWSPRAAPWVWAICIVSLWSLGSFVCSMAPTQPLAEREGFEQAARALEASHDAGTFVVVWPPEHGDALAALPASLTAADAVPIQASNARSVLRVLTIGPTGLDTPPELEAAEESDRRRFGEVEVVEYRWEGGDRIAFDLRASLAEARVRLEGRDVRFDCDRARADGGWDCPGRPAWNHVGPTHLRVDGDDWPCVWAHPVTGHTLVFELGELTLWDRVEVEAALHDDVTGANGASVVVELEVDGVGERRITRSNRRGVIRAALPTERGEVAGVRLRVHTGNDGRRHLGVNLRILEERR